MKEVEGREGDGEGGGRREEPSLIGTENKKEASLVSGPSPEDPQGFYVRPWDHPSAYDLRNPVEESW